MILTKYITHRIKTDWGGSIYFMDKKGRALARLYWYNDDKKTFYIDTLSVSNRNRKKGIGTELQEIREKVGIKMGFKESCLWVKRNSWMHKWYKRRGYVDYKKYEKIKGCIWMKKKLTSK